MPAMTKMPFDRRQLPTYLSKYVYGTTRLGDGAIPAVDRVKIARAAMESGAWFHTSEQYGDALQVLRKAFDEDRLHVPKLIVKLGNDSIDELRACAKRHIEALGVDSLDLGQLCLGGPLAADFRDGGQCYDGFRQLQAEGLVNHFVVEVFPWTSEVPLAALRAGHADGLVGGCIFYLNPLQRFASNALWDLMRERSVPMIAMRTVAGGDVHRLRDVPGAAWKPYLQQRAVQVAKVFERSGVASWTEFCVRFAFSFPEVRATVGASSRSEGLADFLRASQGDIAPLPEDVVEQITRLQRRWSDETDVHSEPWSM
jgi:aryl-alcohol dehydrogenase-like predicted oxidoreductase